MSDGLASYSKTSTTYDELAAGETISQSGMVLTGQGKLIRGTILGQNSTSGKWARAERPAKGILTHDLDTTAGDVVGVIHVQGKYKDNVIVLPDAITLAQVRQEMWDTGVYLLDVQE